MKSVNSIIFIIGVHVFCVKRRRQQLSLAESFHCENITTRVIKYTPIERNVMLVLLTKHETEYNLH